MRVDEITPQRKTGPPAIAFAGQALCYLVDAVHVADGLVQADARVQRQIESAVVQKADVLNLTHCLAAATARQGHPYAIADAQMAGGDGFRLDPGQAEEGDGVGDGS